MRRWLRDWNVKQMTYCVHCRQLLYLFTLQSPACPDREACARRLHQNQHEPSEDWSVSDTRPADIEVCSRCYGTKIIIISRDWASGANNVDECPRCVGTGVDPAQVPV